MLRNLSAAVVAAGALTLGGCNELTSAQIAQIQATAVQICGFLPTAVQIAGFIPNVEVVAGAAIVTPIAQSICAVVNAHGGRLGAGLAGGTRTYTTTVNGTQVTFSGYFVNASHAVRRHH